MVMLHIYSRRITILGIQSQHEEGYQSQHEEGYQGILSHGLLLSIAYTILVLKASYHISINHVSITR
jgi:hypothetical protein